MVDLYIVEPTESGGMLQIASALLESWTSESRWLVECMWLKFEAGHHGSLEGLKAGRHRHGVQTPPSSQAHSSWNHRHGEAQARSSCAVTLRLVVVIMIYQTGMLLASLRARPPPAPGLGPGPGHTGRSEIALPVGCSVEQHGADHQPGRTVLIKCPSTGWGSAIHPSPPCTLRVANRQGEGGRTRAGRSRTGLKGLKAGRSLSR